MPELLLELLSEEIPARMQVRAAEDLKRLVCDGLKASGLAFTKAEEFATPRRLVLVVDGLPVKQPDMTEEGKGPRADATESAKNGFLGKLGLDTAKRIEAISELEHKSVGQWWHTDVLRAPGQLDRVGIRKRTLEKGLYLVFEIKRKGRNTAEILPEIICDAVRKLAWPKSMRWADKPIRWIRPLNNVVAIFNRRVLRGAVFGLPFRMTTLGHSFIAPRPLTIRGFSDYKDRLFRAKVILDPAERRDRIQAEAEKLANKAGLKLKHDVELVDEVAGLVEWPVCKLGAIDKSFMELPPELLTTVMRHHQKYFALTDGKGRLAPKFVVVLNTETRDGGKAAVAGNERVLRARLADARFFWNQDHKRTLESRVGDLGGRVFHAKLGTVWDKVERITALAKGLAKNCRADPDDTARAAKLCKADLSSGMVGEFPELQGVIGRYYALHDGEKPAVADAIAEHYSPQGPSDDCPSKPVSVAVALADKIDTLVGFWCIDEKPTGSRDPFALRRAALGVIRIILENELNFAVRPLIEASWPYDSRGHDQNKALNQQESLRAFLFDRLKVHLRDRGTPPDLIEALFAGGREDYLLRAVRKAEALKTFLQTNDGANLLVAYKRANNIVEIESKKDKKTYFELPNENLFHQEEERALWKALNDTAQLGGSNLEMIEFEIAVQSLARLRKPVDDFFDHVTVNCDDTTLRANRLRLLFQISATMNSIADFSCIQGGER